MKAMQVIFLTLLVVLVTSAQVLKSGKCPKPAVQANFDASKYLGKWYEIKKLPNRFQLGECSTALYNLKSPGVIEVLNSELLGDGTISSVVGTATVKDPSDPAKLEVTFFQGTPPGPYWVLSTDYESHSLVYGCTDYGLFHLEYSWILSREPTLPEETLEELDGILSSIGVDVNKLDPTNQNEAFCSAMHK
uniref:Apolipoprotein D n=1 Tax=Gasterosteus aculeatus aculeatus TaxID=481459 RepID=G3PXW5_GASAC|nr:apolipoprotein D-like [Gasterosteus aculeatus aculeatus]XP_040028340.1 apolipoprotein D-like [Gasterosteus aculeatus aculeatus]